MNNANQHIPAGYKSSPLGIIPENWEVKRLGEIAEISSGTTPLRANIDFYSNGNIPWVKTTDLNNGVLTSTEELITNKALEKTSLRLLPKGTVLVAMYGGFNQIGRTAMLGIEATINQALSALICNEEIYDSFLLAWLNCKVNEWKHLAASSRKDPNITGKDVERFPILVPKIEEQQRIVSVLSLWDTAISKQTQLVEKLTLRKRGLMQQLLMGKKRLKGFEGEWKEVKLGEIARITMGQSPDSKYYNEIGLGLPLIQGNADIQDRKSIQRIWTSNITKTCEVDDIIMSVRAPVGEIARSTQKSCIGRGVCAIRNTGIEKEYLYQLLLSEEDSWKNIEQGGTFTAINSNEIQKKTVVIPTKNEQNSIASVLVSADKEIEIQKQKLTSLQEQKKGLMQVLLTGKKRVK